MTHPEPNSGSTCPRGKWPAMAIIAVVILALTAAVFLLTRMDKLGSSGGPASTFSYESVAFPLTDPGLIHYYQSTTFSPKLATLTSVSAGEGFLLAGGDNAVIVLDTDGSQRRRIDLDRPVRCLASVGKSIFIAGRNSWCIVAVDAAGPTEWFELDAKANISSIAAAPDGREVFIADRGNGWVWRFDAHGKVLGFIGRDSETLKPSHFAVQKILCFDLGIGIDGLLRVVDPVNHRIETYSPDGTLMTSWGQEGGIDGFVGCCNPTDIAMFPDGRIVTSQKGPHLPRVKVHDADGHLLSVVAMPDAFAQDNAGMDIAVDSAGNVLVADVAGGRIHVFKKKDGI